MHAYQNRVKDSAFLQHYTYKSSVFGFIITAGQHFISQVIAYSGGMQNFLKSGSLRGSYSYT